MTQILLNQASKEHKYWSKIDQSHTEHFNLIILKFALPIIKTHARGGQIHIYTLLVPLNQRISPKLILPLPDLSTVNG